jgi:hypothetical protein
MRKKSAMRQGKNSPLDVAGIKSQEMVQRAGGQWGRSGRKWKRCTLGLPINKVMEESRLGGLGKGSRNSPCHMRLYLVALIFGGEEEEAVGAMPMGKSYDSIKVNLPR